jgi:hypothetical protein
VDVFRPAPSAPGILWFFREPQRALPERTPILILQPAALSPKASASI